MKQMRDKKLGIIQCHWLLKPPTCKSCSGLSKPKLRSVRGLMRRPNCKLSSASKQMRSGQNKKREGWSLITMKKVSMIEPSLMSGYQKQYLWTKYLNKLKLISLGSNSAKLMRIAETSKRCYLTSGVRILKVCKTSSLQLRTI